MNQNSEPEITFNEAAKLLQAIAANPPLLVIGSGCTVPHGLPTMGQLADHLQDNVRSDDAEWDAFCETLSAGTDLEAALQQHELSTKDVERVVSETWTLVSQRDLAFYDTLVSNQVGFPLRALLTYYGRTATPDLHAVTTNYDRVIEYAADLAGFEAVTGFTRGHIQRPTKSKATPQIARHQARISIHKVHGSLDWFRNAHERDLGIPLARSIPDGLRPQIITPGNSKYEATHQPPFRHIIAGADDATQAASNILLLGYGFNDDHLEPNLKDQVAGRSTPITVATHTLSPNGRTLLLGSDRPRRYLILEAHGDGTKLHAHNHPNGAILPNHQLWSLSGFVDALHGDAQEPA